MSDDNATQDLPDQPTAEEVSLEATEDRDDGDLDLTQSTESDHVALAHSVGEQRCCTESAECHSVSPPQDVHVMDEKLRPIQAHLEYLLNKADEYQAHLIQRRDRLQIEALCRVVPTFLKSCHPFFSYLEHTARSCLPHRALLPGYIRTQLLHFSQQLCSRLEELILTYASYNFLTLEETNPLSISHFFIGHCQVNHIKLSIFRYCRPPAQQLPIAGIEVQDGGGGAGGRERKNNSTEYYFLCYEEVRREEDGSGEEEESLSEGERGEEEEEGERRERRSEVKMWSIGQWVQTYPNPETDDIYEWIPCGIPRAHYQQLFHLGLTEPSVCSATDCLLGALLSYDSQ
ncbi:UPF0575 protein C19orf67 homolog [Alosa alosa]|uniref:UPF0575 protein C19orf67 homolog n=1 Tax=Alosa alosa TaxID=278164 RepID=UPI002015434D|nr:UPF0575 protein C19orf67 homolog [Alosa alosa]